MVSLAIVALLSGVGYGLIGFDIEFINILSTYSNYILYALMFFVGISVGLHRGLVAKIREHHLKILIVPTVTIIASVLGGYLCSFITGYPTAISTAIGSGMGWYSLVGITIGDLAGAQYGSVAFLSSLMREMGSFFAIPILSKKMGYYSCVAAAGATSEDTTLPMLIKYTDEHIVIIAVINGMICSSAVPILISALLI